jgi:hypothetical protein
LNFIDQAFALGFGKNAGIYALVAGLFVSAVAAESVDRIVISRTELGFFANGVQS